MPASFFACYLLTPALAPRHLRCTYVGFTVSPARRLRQHNGELAHGARRTAKYRPWDMLGVVHGFPTKFHALQFEWAWQHPHASRLTRERLAALKGAKGVGAPRSVKRKLRELHEMLHVPPWSQFPLTVSYTSDATHEMARALLGASYRWPAHMTCETRPLSEFARIVRRFQSGEDARASDEEDANDMDMDPEACFICEQAFDAAPECSDSANNNTARAATTLCCYHRDCPLRCHTLCLADHFVATADATKQSSTQIRPENGSCPCCARELLWPLLTQQTRGQALGIRGTASTTTEAPKRKRRRRENVERDRSRNTTTSEQVDIQQHVENTLPGPGGVVEVATNDGSPEYDDSGWFEDDDVPMQSDSHNERNEKPSPVRHVGYTSIATTSDGTHSPYRAGTVNASAGGSGRAQNVDRTRTDRAEPPAPVIVDLTLDEDDDYEL